jgi:hypothetical protein
MCARTAATAEHIHKNASKKIFSFQAIGRLRGPAAKFLAKYSDLPDRTKKVVRGWNALLCQMAIWPTRLSN